MSKIGRGLLFVALMLFSISFCFAASNASLVHDNGTLYDYLYYEQINSTTNTSPLVYGSDSYHDYSFLNGNAKLHLCDDNLTVNQQVDLRYYTEGYNQTKSVLYFPQYISSVSITNTSGNGTTLCTTVDVRLASMLALYPGFLSVYTDNDTLLVPKINQSLNGSYDVGVTVKSTPKRYLFSAGTILAQNPNITIDSSIDSIMMSLVSANDTVLVEEQLTPSGQLIYYDALEGGERIFINGIPSLEIKIFNPCETINESGYYILNNTNNTLIRETTSTCVTIANLSNIVLNFGDDYIDGDNLTNGSLAEGVCPVVVENSRNVTFESFQTQEFYYGLCIYNSTVNLFGDGSTFNTVGAFITGDSEVEFESISFANSDAEIQVYNNSLVRLNNVSLATSHLNAQVKDVIMRSVEESREPPLPAPDANGTDIDQFVEINSSGSSDSWAQINFIYPEPLPNGLAIDDVSVLKYNGTYLGQNVTTTVEINGTNVTTTEFRFDWYNGTWIQLFTLVSPQTKEIIAPNQSSFSVFAPFAYEINNTNPEPDPDPDPDPDPNSGPTGGASSGGSGGGSGGSPQSANDEVSALITSVRLNISFDDPFTLEQGQPFIIPFELNNTGNVTASDITIVANVEDDWETVIASIESLEPNQSVSDGVLIAPHEKAVPREYKVAVDVYIGNGLYKVTSDIVTINVIPAEDLRRLRVVEYPPVIQMAPNEELNVSFLVANVGSNDLIDVQLQFSENTCLRNINGRNSILEGETKLFRYNFFSNQPGNCDIELTFYEGSTLVGFVPLTLDISTRPGIDATNTGYILLVLLFAWTVLTFFVVARRREKKETSSSEVKHEL